MKWILMLSDKKSKYISFTIGVVLVYVILIVNNVQDFPGDTSQYWLQSDKLFMVDGHFQLNYDPELAKRGYLAGLFYFIMRGFTLLPIWGYWALFSIFISAFFTILLPYLFTTITQKPWFLIARIIPLILTVFFWPFVYVYPASELPALFFSSISLLCLCKITQHVNDKKQFIIRLLFAALLGGSLYASYNIRPIFVYNIAIAILVLIWFYRKKLLQLLPIVCVCLIGFGILSAPQLLINCHVFHKTTISNPLQLYSAKYANSARIMCSSGQYQAYLSDISPTVQRGVAALDPVAKKLWEKNSSCDEFTFRQWLSAFYHHPLQSLGIYGVKLVNFFDMRFGDVYFDIKKIGDRTVKNLLGFIFWFISFFGLFLLNGSRPRANQSEQKYTGKLSVIKQRLSIVNFDAVWPILYFIFPIFPAFLTSVEQRYFLPLFLACTIFLANYFPWKKFIESILKHPLMYFAIWGGGIHGRQCSIQLNLCS